MKDYDEIAHYLAERDAGFNDESDEVILSLYEYV